jgi:integrase
MPFRRAGRPTYYIGPFTTAGIHIPRISTGVKNKETAKNMEAMLKTLPARGYIDLVREVVGGTLKLDALLAAYHGPNSDDALKALQSRRNNKLLTEIIGEKAEFESLEQEDGTRVRRETKAATGLRASISDERTAAGLDQLLALAPVNSRLSWLREPTNITDLYQRALRGEGGEGPRRPNSVRRSLHRAVSEVLSRALGRGKTLAIMADVRVPSEYDERVVLLSPAEIVRALEAADAELQPVIGLAVTTGIDRGASRATRVRHYDEETGALQVIDTKAKARPRTLILRGEPVLENAEYWLRRLVAGRKGHERLVNLTERQIRTRWEAVRDAIGRPDVRWKDLRGIFATYYLQAGGDARDLQHVLGHSGMAMTLRYLRRLPVGNRERLREAARRVGRLGERGNLRAEHGS